MPPLSQQSIIWGSLAYMHIVPLSRRFLLVRDKFIAAANARMQKWPQRRMRLVFFFRLYPVLKIWPTNSQEDGLKAFGACCACVVLTFADLGWSTSSSFLHRYDLVSLHHLGQLVTITACFRCFVMCLPCLCISCTTCRDKLLTAWLVRRRLTSWLSQRSTRQVLNASIEGVQLL